MNAVEPTGAAIAACGDESLIENRAFAEISIGDRASLSERPLSR